MDPDAPLRPAAPTSLSPGHLSPRQLASSLGPSADGRPPHPTEAEAEEAPRGAALDALLPPRRGFPAPGGVGGAADVGQLLAVALPRWKETSQRLCRPLRGASSRCHTIFIMSPLSGL